MESHVELFSPLASILRRKARTEGASWERFAGEPFVAPSEGETLSLALRPRFWDRLGEFDGDARFTGASRVAEAAGIRIVACESEGPLLLRDCVRGGVLATGGA